VKGTTLALIFILTLFAVSSLRVQSVKSSSITIVVPDDFSTIQEAVDNALPGQTVFVRAGVYTEQHVTVDKPLSLVGEDSGNTILVGINNIRYSPPYVVQISADHVTVSGFTITNGSIGGIRVETVGSDIQPTGCVITGNNIVNNSDGISTYDGTDLTISNNHISNNREYGVYLSTSQTNIFENNITENGWAGIVIDSCEQVTVSSNNVAENGNQGTIEEYQGGIMLRWHGNFEIYANNITNNGYGVQFGEGCSNSSVHDNNIKGNSVGVELFNFILTNNSEGIGIGTDNRVYKNNLENSQNALIETACPYNITIPIAYAIGNGTDSVSWDNGTVGNYWGDYNGQGAYVIDKDNVDHYPLAQQVDIPTAATTDTVGAPVLTIAAVVTVSAVIIGIVVLIYFKKRKQEAGHVPSRLFPSSPLSL
jgi:parallel beta-helix repeat protein